MTFSEEQLKIISQVAARYIEKAETPNKWKSENRFMDATRESTEFPGLPVIGITDGRIVDEDGHGVKAMYDLREEIKTQFAMLAKRQKVPAAQRSYQQPIKSSIPESVPNAPVQKQKSINVPICAFCGFEISHSEALELYKADIPRKEWKHKYCQDKKEGPPPSPAPSVPQKQQQKPPVPDVRIPVKTMSQSGMMIKGFRPSLAEIGKIKIGKKGEMMTSKSGKQFRPPEKYDHFEIVSLMRNDHGDFIADPVMTLLDEPEPKSLDIMLLFNDPELNFVTFYAQYQGGKNICKGDGQKTQTAEGEKACNPETCQTFAEKKCKPNGILSVILTRSPRLGGVYKFRTTSFYSIQAILSSQFFISNLTGGILSMIPLKLTLSPRQVTPAGLAQPVTIYTANIEFNGTAGDLLRKTFEVQKHQQAMKENILRLESTARAVLTAPETKQEISEVEAEFYPENLRERNEVNKI